MISVLNIILPLLYFSVTGLYAWHFFSETVKPGRSITGILVFTVILHLIYLVLRTVQFQHFPTASPAEVFSLIAAAISIIYLLIELIIDVRTTGVFVIIVVAIFQTLSSFIIENGGAIDPLLASPLFSLHTSSAILGYAGIAISALYALLYLLLFYDIKGSKFGLVYNRLPALEVLDSMHIRAASLGFAFLTLTIVLGFLWLELTFGSFFFDWKIISALITWAIFGLVLVSKHFFGWSGKRIAYVSLTGFMTVLISMTVVNYFLTSFHRFH